MKKKGISPLIATVLIIGFTVALAAIVLTWGGGFTKKITETSQLTAEQKMACTDVNIEVRVCRDEIREAGFDELPGQNKIANDKVSFPVQNTGKYDIKKVKARVIFSEVPVEGGPPTAQQTFDANVPSNIAVGQIGAIKHDLLTVDRISGVKAFVLSPVIIWRVEALPIIDFNNEEITCDGARAVLEFGKWGTTEEDFYTIVDGKITAPILDGTPEKYYVFKTC